MTARRHPYPYVFAALTALAPSSKALALAGPWPRTLCSPMLASIASWAPPVPEPDELALSPGARRILELAQRGRESPPPAELVGVLVELDTFLDLLPLMRLVGVELSSTRLELVFDVPERESIAVELRSRTLHVLAYDEDDERDRLRLGRALRVKTDDQTLLVHGRVRFELCPEGIASVREGDLEVEAGPFTFDLAVRTERHAGRIAHDRAGRPVLAVDEQGAPLRRDGRWVPAIYNFWIVLEAFGRRVEVGVPARKAPGA